MFEQALLESARHAPGARRTYSTAASLLLQAAGLATFIIVPVITTQVAPQLQQRTVIVPRLEPPPPPLESSGMQTGSSNFSTAIALRQPRSIERLDPSKPDADAQPVSVHPSGSGTDHPGFPALFSGSGQQVVLGEGGRKKPPIISVLEAGVVLSRVQPIYPYIAVVNRIQGTVHLNAMITSTGTLEDLRVLNGQPVLARAATDAVRQWKFRPYLLNGKPIAVQTEVIVKFSLD